MHLKKLEMKGFKSFAQRAELSFEKGVTAVVGPNGCGKSNVADAIRWVLGEQSARSLRGQKMEDIIFSGTDRKKPQGLAEVTITFDNSSELLPVPYHEVAITRRVYRSGESEYFINQTRCRLKDVREMLMDTGIGKEGYSIIGQGRIDELLSQRGEERRLLFDEAAGIVKFRTRKEEAEKKMNHTDENLNRLKDIMVELEGRIGPLKKQAEKAEKYLLIREKVALLEVNVLIRDHEKNSHSISQIQTEQSEREEQLKMITQQLVSIETDQQREQFQINQYQIEEENIDKQIRSLENQIEESRTQSRLKEQTKQHLEEQRLRVHENSLTIQKEKEFEYGQAETTSEELIHQQKLIQEKEEKLISLNERIEAESQQLKTRQDRLEDNKAGIIETLNEIAGLKAKKERVQALKDAADERENQISQEMERINQVLQVETNQCNTLTQEIAVVKQALEFIRNKIHQQEVLMQTLEERLIAIDKNLYQVNQEHDQCQHRKNTLVNMEKSFDGFQRGVKNVLRAVHQQSHLSNGFHGVIADLLRVPKGYETAVETALGPALQYLVTEEESQAKKIIEFLKQNHQGRVTILPIRVIKGRQLNNHELQLLENYQDAACALDRVSFPSPYQSIFENLLGRVVIAGQLDTAIQIARDCKHQLKITTLEGDLIQPGGSMTGGSVSQQQDGLLVRKREIEELGNQIHSFTNKLSDLELKRKMAADEKNSIMRELIEQKQLLTQKEQSLFRMESELESSNKQCEGMRQQLTRMQTEHEQLTDHTNNMKTDVDSILCELHSKEQNLADVRADVEREVNMQQQLQNQFDELSHQYNKIQIESAGYREKEIALTSALKSIYGRLEMIERREKSMTEEMLNYQCREESLTKEINDLLEKNLQLDLEKEEKVVERQRVEQLKENCQIQLKSLQEDARLQKDQGESLKEKSHQSELKISKFEWQLQQIEEKLQEHYQFNPTQARVWLKSNEQHELKLSDLPELKRNLVSLGDVHVGALDEYKRVKERYDFLIQQQHDLLEAKESLVKIISELEEHMIKQFEEQFNKIQKRFKEVFQRLFHGGNTELILQNPDDLLATGIDIIAQPPGKKSQHLSLLSGGEKALTAISLLFGILLVKPSPFCVLDEIEAALDDANVSRFADYLVTLSDDIQFVVVTHKKQTMERAQTLYGITMQEKGISKLLTLKLQDIDQNMIAG